MEKSWVWLSAPSLSPYLSVRHYLTRHTRRERSDTLTGRCAKTHLNNGPQKAPAKIYMTLKGWGWGQEYRLFKKKQQDGQSDKFWRVRKSWKQDIKALEASLLGQLRHIQHSTDCVFVTDDILRLGRPLMSKNQIPSALSLSWCLHRGDSSRHSTSAVKGNSGIGRECWPLLFSCNVQVCADDREVKNKIMGSNWLVWTIDTWAKIKKKYSGMLFCRLCWYSYI